MADFQTRVDGLTGLTVTTDYGAGQLTEYLKDGVIDVTTRIIAIKPQEVENFLRTTSSDSQSVDVGRSQIVAVLREAGADGSSDGSTAWRACRKISAAMQSRVVDANSFHFASIYNPVYAIENNGVVNVYPVPSSNNGIKVFHVNKTPVNGSGASLEYNHDDILYFPEDKVYLVVLYAGIKVLYNALANKGDTLEASRIMPELPVLPAIPSVPTAPSFSSQTLVESFVSNLGIAPTFTAPKVGGETEELTTSMTALTGNATGTDGDFQDFSKWFTAAGEYIEDEEDIDLASAQLAKIESYLKAYSAQLQANTAEFTAEAAEYQGKLQEAIKKADLDAAKAAADANFAQTAEIQEYTAVIGRYEREIQIYVGQVTGLVGVLKESVQRSLIDLEQYKTEYGWMEARLTMLKSEYDNAFVILAGVQQPPQPQQQQQPRRRGRR